MQEDKSVGELASLYQTLMNKVLFGMIKDAVENEKLSDKSELINIEARLKNNQYVFQQSIEERLNSIFNNFETEINEKQADNIKIKEKTDYLQDKINILEAELETLNKSISWGILFSYIVVGLLSVIAFIFFLVF